MPRIVGIRHRVKRTAAGEARPTQVVILDETSATYYNLETEGEELDFLMGRFVTAWRPAKPNEDLSQIFERHIRTHRKRGSDEIETVIPASYVGYRLGDTVAMISGGSGNNFAFALSRKGEEIGAYVLRIPSGALSDNRPADRDESHDALTLAELVRDKPELFQPTAVRDRTIISIRGLLQERLDAMKDRIACEQRLWQRTIGGIFRIENGYYPEGRIDDLFAEKKTNDAGLKTLRRKEAECNRALLAALKELNVYTDFFELVEGCGPAIASRVIALIGDVGRFPTAAKFKAFLGVHCTSDGQFSRRRKGERANWNEEWGRKAFYLLGDQFNRRPGSVWGKKLLEYKKRFREKHPVIECVACGVVIEQCIYMETENPSFTQWDDIRRRFPKLKPENMEKKFHFRCYTDGHILNMALWRTRTKFAEWLYKEWRRLERVDVKRQLAV